MSKWKDAKKNHNGSNYVKINVVQRLQMKKSKIAETLNNPVFTFYDGEKDIEIPKPIKGVFIDNGLEMSLYVPATGMTIRTTVYFKKTDYVKIFCTPQNNEISSFVGTADQAYEFIFQKTRKEAKKRVVLYFATKSGLISIATNASLFYTQIKKVRSQIEDYLAMLTPTKYKFEDFATAKLNEAFVTVCETNPPQYASIEIAKTKENATIPISDELFEEYDLEYISKNIQDYKKSISAKDSSSSIASEEEEDKLKDTEVGDKDFHKQEMEKLDAPAMPAFKKESNYGDDNDDLPF